MKNNRKTKILWSILLLLGMSLSTMVIQAEEMLIPMGKTVGVSLNTQGVTVVNTADFPASNGTEVSPAEDAGIHPGDVIESINEEPINTAEELEEIVSREGNEELKINLRRNEKEKTVIAEAKRSSEDGKYRLGVWVKDRVSGIGTLTYYHPDTGEFGGLGHGISDTDEKEITTISGGEIMDAKLVSIQKGGKGQPGELIGIFSEEEPTIGTVTENSPVGIKGVVQNPDDWKGMAEAIPMGSREEAEVGEAVILSNIEEGKISPFRIEIQKINRDKKNLKGMIIKVTDVTLLEKTGGIVQGMSGSPIIQNSKLIGAVTHVFVNDPTKGYGIFIENMLAEAEKISD